MHQPGGDPDLTQKALGAERASELRVQHLERDRAVVLEVVREVDRGHPAAAELALEAITVSEMCPECLQGGHEHQDTGKRRGRPLTGGVSTLSSGHAFSGDT